MSTSDFRFFRVPEPILNSLTVIYLFRRKVTKPTIRYTYAYVISFLYDSVTIPYAHTHWIYTYTYIIFLMTIDIPAWLTLKIQ